MGRPLRRPYNEPRSLPWEYLVDFAGSHILSVQQFQREDVELIFSCDVTSASESIDRSQIAPRLEFGANLRSQQRVRLMRSIWMNCLRCSMNELGLFRARKRVVMPEDSPKSRTSCMVNQLTEMKQKANG